MEEQKLGGGETDKMWKEYSLNNIQQLEREASERDTEYTRRTEPSKAHNKGVLEGRETDKKLREYLISKSEEGEAKELSERLQAYRKTERMSNSSLQDVLSELSELEDMTPLGKTLVATKEDNPQQRWRDFMRVFIEGRSRKEGWRKGQSQQDNVNDFGAGL